MTPVAPLIAGPSPARALREARAWSGLTQAQVAARAGIPLGTYVAWERGSREVFVWRLAQLADALGVSATDLILWSIR